MDEPTISVSVDRKVSDGNYGSIGVFTSISGVTLETSDEEMDALLDQGAVMFKKIKAKIKEQLKAGGI